MKTNKGLVKYVEKAYKEKWGYVWGTFGQVLTESLLNQKIKQYPKGVGNYQSFIRQNNLGKKTADCVGLIKGYYWSQNGRIKYNGATDVNADTMYARAKKKGVISTIPDVPGICVWRKGHIGVYIGNGIVIEERGTKYGIQKNKLSDRTFTHWLECPYISYVKEEVIPSTEKLPKDKIKVNLLGKNLIVDGYFKEGTNYLLVNDSYIPIRSIFESMGLNVSWNNGVIVK